jgi:hypothetical protein
MHAYAHNLHLILPARTDSRQTSRSWRSYSTRAISDSISPVTKKPLENHAGPMLPFFGPFLLLHSGSARRCGNKNDYGCGIPGVGRRIFRMGAKRYKGNARDIH